VHPKERDRATPDREQRFDPMWILQKRSRDLDGNETRGKMEPKTSPVHHRDPTKKREGKMNTKNLIDDVKKDLAETHKVPFDCRTILEKQFAAVGAPVIDLDETCEALGTIVQEGPACGVMTEEEFSEFALAIAWASCGEKLRREHFAAEKRANALRDLAMARISDRTGSTEFLPGLDGKLHSPKKAMEGIVIDLANIIRSMKK
jgi:hypothetical protein